jgi:sialidase-1
MKNKEYFDQQDVFPHGGRDYYRIPSMVVANDGTILAFTNRRLDTIADGTPEAHLVLRRSKDNGATWEPIVDLFAHAGWTGHIGTTIVDRSTGAVMVSYGRVPQTEAAKKEAEHSKMEAGGFMAVSTDSGATWTHAKMIVKPNELDCMGGSHGHNSGLTLQHGPKAGRLLIPAFFNTPSRFGKLACNCVVFSDDHGKTWQTSMPVQPGTCEGCIAELFDGAIYYNSRGCFWDSRRRIAWSHDSGETFADFSVDENLVEPLEWCGCNAGLIRIPDEFSGNRDIILFSNPACRLHRRRLTLRASYDRGATWPVSRVINEGSSAYSSLAIGRDETMLVLYEGEPGIRLARVNMAWLMQKQQ